ncbi:unnamed protein product [Allacma fusca]|uniref:Uncharacterized protein n=1 Tax=Allacma fusca TaxID=39272 RepID=A0A8J2JLW1_9HEXA|nr:unnamed protein product [Allacma fusca]
MSSHGDHISVYESNATESSIVKTHFESALKSFLHRSQQNSQVGALFQVRLVTIEASMATKLLNLLQTDYPFPKAFYPNRSKIDFEVPIVQGYRSILPRNHYLSHQTLQIFHVINGDIASLKKFLEKMVYVGSAHRDRMIFIGEEKILVELLHSKIVSRLKYKFGIVMEDGRVLKNPIIYDGGKLEASFDAPLFETMLNNLPGRRLKVSAYPNPPYLYVDSQQQYAGGSYYQMLYFMGIKHNYTMEVDHKTPEGSGFYKNGIWNGMTGDVYYRRADVGLFMGLTVERYGIIDTIFLQPDIVHFMTRQADGHIKFLAIFSPYNLTAWLAIFLADLTSGYQINWLAFPEYENIPMDFPTLDSRKEYKVVFNFHAGTSFQYFDTAKSGMIHNVRQRFVLEPDIQKCVIEAAVEKHSVCISWGPVITRAIASNLTLPGPFKPMVVLSKPAVNFPVGFGFQYNSMFTDTFEMIAKYWRDSGLIPKWNSDVYSKFTSKGKSWLKSQKNGEFYHRIDSKWKKSLASVAPFNFDNVAAAFAIVVGGVLLSFIGFVGEIFHVIIKALIVFYSRTLTKLSLDTMQQLFCWGGAPVFGANWLQILALDLHSPLDICQCNCIKLDSTNH